MSKLIVQLGFQSAVDAIKHLDVVEYRSGCWGERRMESVENVIKYIMNSGYGADVREYDDGTLSVCTPSASDMW